ncbi:MAG TPA: GNAT family N-acetyltransferase, partial [Pirellulales bacterium]
MSLPLSPLDVAAVRSADDVRIACDVMLEAARWLTSCGQPLWDQEALAPESVVPSPSEGRLFLAHHGGRAVGAYVLLFEDPRYWPDVPAGEAYYVHKLAIRRSVAGTGAGRGLLEHALAQTAAAGR